MLSISSPMKGAGRGEYYLNLAQEDYYAKAAERPGSWFGEGARQLNLSGKVEPEAFRNLLKGFHSDGHHKLVQNAGTTHRQSGWDLTFSAPKSVSVLWALAPPDGRSRIEQAHTEAVQAALQYLEQTAGMTRRGRGGATLERVALVFATFQHGTSRAQDPQLHTHCVLSNVGVRKDGTTGSLLSKPVFCEKMTAGALYQVHLAATLRQRMGLRVEPERVGFRVVGVPQELCKEFSTRRTQIVAALQQSGRQGAVAAKVAALSTRRRKTDLAYERLFSHWQQVGTAHGWSTRNAQRLLRAHGPQAISQKRFTAKLQDRLSAIPSEQRTRPQVVRMASRLATEHGIGAKDTLAALDQITCERNPRGLRVDWNPLFNEKPWLPPERRLLRREQRSPFAHAPWKRVREMKLPVLVGELPRLILGPAKKFQPRWWTIKWKRNLILGELRIQERRLFPRAPKWSPVHGLAFPAFRLTPKKSKSPPFSQQQDHCQSH